MAPKYDPVYVFSAAVVSVHRRHRHQLALGDSSTRIVIIFQLCLSILTAIALSNKLILYLLFYISSLDTPYLFIIIYIYTLIIILPIYLSLIITLYNCAFLSTSQLIFFVFYFFPFVIWTTPTSILNSANEATFVHSHFFFHFRGRYRSNSLFDHPPPHFLFPPPHTPLHCRDRRQLVQCSHSCSHWLATLTSCLVQCMMAITGNGHFRYHLPHSIIIILFDNTFILLHNLAIFF